MPEPHRTGSRRTGPLGAGSLGVGDTTAGAVAGPEAVGPALRREVVSFTRRDGRRSHRNRQAWDDAHAGLVVEPRRGERTVSLAPDWQLDAAAEFGRVAPLVVEVGAGTGEAIIAAAAAAPDVDHLAVEVYLPGLARTIVAAHRRGLGNVRVLSADAAALFRHGVAPASVSEVRVFFPDPWPKARHHKRRLVDAAFVGDVARSLPPGGLLRMATDWPDYAEAMREAGRGCDLLAERAEASGWAPRFAGRPPTRFERKGSLAGRVIHDLQFVRV